MRVWDTTEIEKILMKYGFTYGHTIDSWRQQWGKNNYQECIEFDLDDRSVELTIEGNKDFFAKIYELGKLDGAKRLEKMLKRNGIAKI